MSPTHSPASFSYEPWVVPGTAPKLEMTPVPAPGPAGQLTIAEAASRCSNCFQQCMQQSSTSISPRGTSLIEDQLARFSLWIANIGVFSSGRASLDHRLREAREVHEIIIGVLESLGDHLQECFTFLELHRGIQPSTDQDQELQNAELETFTKEFASQIALLHRLSNTIRKASAADHNVKASNLFRILDAEGNDLEACLKEVFSHYIRDKFPAIDERILQRLVLAMVARRKRVLYKRHRFGGTFVNVQETSPSPILSPPTYELPQTVILEPPSARTHESGNAPKQIAKSYPKSQAGFSATTLVVDKFRRASAPSTVSTTKTIAFDNYEELPVPVAPLGRVRRKYRKKKRAREEEHKQRIKTLDAQSNSGLPFDVASAKAHAEQDLQSDIRRYWEECLEAVGEVTCPFCFYAIPTSEANDQGKWLAHLKNDLDAYVCIFEQCDTPDHLYRHSEEWLKHMSQHSLHWRCNSKSHGPLAFDTIDKYTSHVKEAHKGAFNEAQLRVLADRSARTLNPLFDFCPFCGLREFPHGGNIEVHIVGHLRFLALKSLPPYDDEASGCSDLESASSAFSNPRQRSTIDQDPDRNIYLLFEDEGDNSNAEVASGTDAMEAQEGYLEMDTETSPSAGSSVEQSRPDWNSTTEKRLLEWGFVTEDLEISTDIANDPVLREMSLNKQSHKATTVDLTEPHGISEHMEEHGNLLDHEVQNVESQTTGKLDMGHSSVSNQTPAERSKGINFQWQSSLGYEHDTKQVGDPQAGAFRPQADVPITSFDMKVPLPSTFETFCRPAIVVHAPPDDENNMADTFSGTNAREISQSTVEQGPSSKEAIEGIPGFSAQPSTEFVANSPISILSSELDDMISRLLGSADSPNKTPCLSRDEALKVCVASREVFLSQPMLLELEAPVKVVGDVHGQYFDLIRIFERCGFPLTTNYLFLGDYVDRGKQSLEIVLLLFCYKLKYPEHMLLLRGNHECASINRIYGFYDECKRRYDIKIWKSFSDVFNCLPVAAIIDNKVFCVHGGLSPDRMHMDQIRRLPRPTDVPDAGLLCDLLWSDPDLDANDWSENDRGVSYIFNKKIIKGFLEKHDFDLICRAHQVVEDGYEMFEDRLLVTIFSATNYCGEFDNAGGVMCLSDDLVCSFEVIQPLNPKKDSISGWKAIQTD